MSNVSLFSLICAALPTDLHPASLCPPATDTNLWENDLKQCESLLRNCASIDWEAYTANNRDIEVTGLDPLSHFLRHGVFEGRKLHLKNSVDVSPVQKQISDSPLISLIILNRNNDLLLERLLLTIFMQTIKNYEVIVVDINSQDESRKILKDIAAKNKKIKLVFINFNCTDIYARKNAVKISQGSNIIFLKSTTTLFNDSCETALNAALGCDIVSFNINPIIDRDNINKIKYNKLYNIGEEATYQKMDILPVLFVDKKISSKLDNKIINGNLARSIYSELENTYKLLDSDFYELLILAAKANTLKKINHTLACLRIEEETVSLEDLASFKSYFISDYKAIKNFLVAKGLLEYLPNFDNEYVRETLDNFLFNSRDEDVTVIFNFLGAELGIINILKKMVDRYFKKWEIVSRKIKHYRLSGKKNHEIKNIGILYFTLGNGGAENVIRKQIEILGEIGFEITLFLAQSHPRDAKLPTNIKIKYLGSYDYDKALINNTLQNLYIYLQEEPVDVMLCHAASWDESFLWKLTLLKFLDIPSIAYLHSSFYRRLLYPTSDYTIHQFTSVLGCADKVVCLSRYAELYFRNQGIDSVYIHNPVTMPNSKIGNFKERENWIVICGRLNDPIKNISDALYIIYRVVKQLPYAKAVFIGSFGNQKSRDDFFALVDLLELRENIILTGWTDNAASFFEKSKVMLCTSYAEAFPLAIAEAQSHGMPVVMYEIPIMQAKGNPSVIQVPQRDMDKGAEAIVSLFQNPGEWNSLSQIARQSSAAFSEERYAEALRTLLETMGTSSPMTYFTPEEYRVVMRTLAYYGCHNPPWN